MANHPIRDLIEAADRAITGEDFDALLDFYADDAVLIVAPGRIARGKAEISKAFVAIAAHFDHSIAVSQGRMEIIESGGTALVIMETLLDKTGGNGGQSRETRRATYVFRKDDAGRWLCAIDNSYGTDILDATRGDGASPTG